MPTRPMRRCTTPGCPRASPDGGRCEPCAKRRGAVTNQRRDGWVALYGPAWPRVRLDYLTRHPVCALCPRLAAVPDHYPLGIRALRAMGVTDPHSDRRLRPLCKGCHDKETARHEPGGWNRPRRD
jgi:5-methylcytosine-specific restriction protein A